MSIRTSIMIIFISAMLISVCGIGYTVYANWFKSAQLATERISDEINDNIYNGIYAFLDTIEKANESHQHIVGKGIVDMTDTVHRDQFFAGALKSFHEEVYSFSYGAANGEYYGARKNEHNTIELMKNNAGTGGNSWYYSVNDDLTADKLVLQTGQFDPRTRAWYQAAAASRNATFSPVYKHFVMNDLAISYACPIYDTVTGRLQGVLGTHLLLTRMNDYLSNAVSKYSGYAVIVEKSSGALIANSMETGNFVMLQDGALQRYRLDQINRPDISEAYRQYTVNSDPSFLFTGSEGSLTINAREISANGLDWVVITAIPESYLVMPIKQIIPLTVLMAATVLLLSILAYSFVIGKRFFPINELLLISAAFSAGDYTQRAKIARYDEVGRIADGFNSLAGKMQYLIHNLEAAVKERTEDLNRANGILQENKNQLRLILDSAAEAIYGIDLNGNCTFCNTSCVQLLGYKEQNDLLGKNMHDQIHHARACGKPLPVEDCRIYKAMQEKKGAHVDDEVFWKADGTSFSVEYRSYPQIKDGEVIGGVITFMDITDRKQKEAEIRYLSSHDTATGLCNRRCFDDNRRLVDIQANLPLSVIFADVNGLKMTNDIFGHVAGDMLIKKTAEILKRTCREHDVISRIGGDEFVILLPNTHEGTTEKIVSRIRSEFTSARVEAIKCSISLGYHIKTSTEQSLDEVMANAENAMYKDKAMHRTKVNKDIINTIIETLHARNSREKQHSAAVSDLCGQVGIALRLPVTEIEKLKRAGYLHDIGKITLDASILSNDLLSEEDHEKMKQHPVVGYRILNLLDETLDLADHVYSHHERWDGNGYPRGLKGEQISILSRVISIVETYERVLNRGGLPAEERKKHAVRIIESNAGTLFDPEISRLFVRIIQDA